MWKNILAASVFVMSLAFLIRSIPFAQAEIGPAVNLGSNPYVSFAGELSLNSSAELQLITVPSGQNLIITGASFWDYDCDLLVDGDLEVDGTLMSIDFRSSPSSLKTGNARLVIPSGSVLSIGTKGYNNNNSCYDSYLVEGYYVRS